MFLRLGKKKIERFLEKQDREVPQMVITICSVVMNCGTSLLGFKHFPYQPRSSQKVFSAKTGSFSTRRHCFHTVLD